ncbi:MAG: hypothetical protein ACRD50_01280 [Candidatus Acidiferrales bacterium]
MPGTTLARSLDIPVTGDLRPLWRISGRIHNHCPRELTDLTFAVEVYKKGSSEELDSAELILKETIPGFTARGFVEEVHLRLPEKGWTWSIEPVKGKFGALPQ